jgi:hypothetical protein
MAYIVAFFAAALVRSKILIGIEFHTTAPLYSKLFFKKFAFGLGITKL